MAFKNLLSGKLKSVVGSIAPNLGAALGGPLGGMAGSVIAEVLGVPNTPKAIEQGILKEKFVDHDIQAKTGSDSKNVQDASIFLGH